MTIVKFLDRKTKKIEEEKIYGKLFIQLLYENNLACRIASKFVLPLFAQFSFLSKVYGRIQKTRWSRRKIVPFIKTFGVDSSEFLQNVEAFKSFNDFFIRRLKSSCRPIVQDKEVVVFPADGRYLVYPQVDKHPFVIKQKTFDLMELLNDSLLHEKYRRGSLVIGRLAPVDYHRFHFPFDCVAGEARLINGFLYSVNPIALKRNIAILNENKRMITSLQSDVFGQVLYIEVGATYVGSIKQTYNPGSFCEKGEQKGYFEFGGSSILLLFEEGRIEFDQDFLEASQHHLEVRSLFGQSMGKLRK